MTWQSSDDGFQELEVDSADDFIAMLRRSSDHWWQDDRCSWIFRGQANVSWPLLPAAWRPGNPVIDGARAVAEERFDVGSYSPELRWNTGNWISGRTVFGQDDSVLARRLVIEVSAEVALAYDFAHCADRAGIDLPISGELPPDPGDENWLHAPNEPLLADDLLRWHNVPQLLALAQHYRIPTRLLDWTNDPMAAAFFAAFDPSESTSAIAVYALHTGHARTVSLTPTDFPQLFDADKPDGNGPRIQPALRLVRPARVANPNMTAQSGLFTAIEASGVDFMRRGGRRPDLEAFVRESGVSAPTLRKMVLPSEHVRRAKALMEREQVTLSRLMPSLDSVALDVAQRWARAGRS